MTAVPLAPLREDETACSLLQNLKERRNLLAAVNEFRVSLPDAERPVEEFRLPAARRRPLLHDLVEDLLEQARHGGHNRRAYLAQVLADQIERRRVCDRHAVPAEDV